MEQYLKKLSAVATREAVETGMLGINQTTEESHLATAVRPWKTDRCSCGKSSASRAIELQWGHGGEAVENNCTGTPRGCTAPLQFGHGGEAVENGSEVGDRRVDLRASIRPRR